MNKILILLYNKAKNESLANPSSELVCNSYFNPCLNIIYLNKSKIGYYLLNLSQIFIIDRIVSLKSPLLLREKIFYSRSTNSAAFYALQRMSLPTPFPSMQLK